MDIESDIKRQGIQIQSHTWWGSYIPRTQAVGISPAIPLGPLLGIKELLFISGSLFLSFAIKDGVCLTQMGLNTVSSLWGWASVPSLGQSTQKTDTLLPGRESEEHSPENKCAFQRCKGLAGGESGDTGAGDIENNVFFLPCQSLCPEVSHPLDQWH